MPTPPRTNATRLPDAELDVLTCLRRSGESTASEIGRALETQRPMAHGSVVTLLTRLEAKGMVTRRKGPVGKAFVFRATARADRALQQALKRWMGRVLENDRVSLVASLLESKPPSFADLDRLQRLLADLRARRRAAEPR